MTTISENLQELKDTKERLKTALENKGQDLTNVPFTQYPEKVSAIESGPEIDLSQTTATSEDVFEGKQFYNAQGELVVGGYKDMLQRKVDSTKNCQQLLLGITDEDMSWVRNLNTTGVTNMSNMFYNCTKAKTIDVSNFDTNSVNTMSGMFNMCTELKNIIGLNNIKGSNVTTIASMFSSCNALENIDLSNFTPTNIVDMNNAFKECSVVNTIKIKNVKTSAVTTMAWMFGRCRRLETVLGSLNMINVTSSSNMFLSCSDLKNLTLKNIKVTLDLSSCSKLTNETLINTIQELWDLTGSTSQTLSLSTTSENNIANIYVKLIDVTDEMRAEDEYIDNKKPCVVCESTDAGAMTLTEYAISKNWAIA